MSAIIYGIGQTRVTLYATDGVTPTKRITLQKEDKEGLVLSFKPEGVSHDLGSGANFAKKFNLRGFRPQLSARWSVGLDPSLAIGGAFQSYVEIWNSTSSSWGAATPTGAAYALSMIFSSAFKTPCLVEPHLDTPYSFKAQPDPSRAFALQDLKAVVHTKLDLSLIGVELVDGLPDWSTFWVGAGYVDQDWVAMGTLGS